VLKSSMVVDSVAGFQNRHAVCRGHVSRVLGCVFMSAALTGATRDTGWSRLSHTMGDMRQVGF
jgi:hypothetical protein